MADPLSLDDFFDGVIVDEVNLAGLIGTARDRADADDDDATIWTGLVPPWGRDLGLLLLTPHSQDAIRADLEGAVTQIGLVAVVTVDGETGQIQTQTSLFILAQQALMPAG